jgi:type I restriction enzyme M protein
MPHGVLFRGGEEKKIRQALVEHDHVEAVIGLASNLFYGTGIPACVLVLRAEGAKQAGRRGKVLFINAVDEVTRERAQSFLKDEHIDKILRAYRNYEDVEGFAKIAGLEEIRGKDYTLNIPLYVRRPKGPDGDGEGEGGKDLGAVIAEWEESSATLRASMDGLFTMLKEAGIGG